MKRISVLLVILMATALTQAQDVTGDWQGSLSAAGAELRLVLHVTKGSDGALNATLDSVDQGANGIPVNSVTLKNSKLSLGIDAVHGTYEGTVSPDAKTISGTWTQNTSLPLEFKRVDDADQDRAQTGEAFRHRWRVDGNARPRRRSSFASFFTSSIPKTD